MSTRRKPRRWLSSPTVTLARPPNSVDGSCEVLDGAAKVAGGGHAQRAYALRQLGAGEVLGDQRTRDAQPVVVAVAVVAQRNAIERVARAALVEAAQADGLRFLVGAEGIIDCTDTPGRRSRIFCALVPGGSTCLSTAVMRCTAGFALSDHRHGVECGRWARRWHRGWCPRRRHVHWQRTARSPRRSSGVG